MGPSGSGELVIVRSVGAVFVSNFLKASPKRPASKFLVPDKETEGRLDRLRCLDPPLSRFSLLFEESSSSFALRKSTSESIRTESSPRFVSLAELEPKRARSGGGRRSAGSFESLRSKLGLADCMLEGRDLEFVDLDRWRLSSALSSCSERCVISIEALFGSLAPCRDVCDFER